MLIALRRVPQDCETTGVIYFAGIERLTRDTPVQSVAPAGGRRRRIAVVVVVVVIAVVVVYIVYFFLFLAYER